jgi:signal transduction histidine kinase
VRARSGEEALARSAEQEFALALLDWRMPGIDGIETARAMRERVSGRQPPVIILTAHLPDFAEIKTAYAAGVVDFLQKPFAPEVLAAKASVFVELHAQREKLRLYERALRKRFEEDLVSIVSHDLRSPLNAILLAAQSMRRRAEVGESDQRSLRIIQSAAGRAGRLVHDLLDYTQVLHGTAPVIQRERFCLLALTSEILEELKASFPTAQFIVESSGKTEGRWDRDRLAQVVANLASNAATYGAGGPIAVKLVGSESGVALEVHNQGEPIPEELLPELFEPRRRGSATGRQGSIGLGLFIVREIVRALGGSVTVQSASEGTTFAVCLPSAPENEQTVAVQPMHNCHGCGESSRLA